MFNNYPYTDAHELNLDFILKKIKELNIIMDEFVVKNAITYHGQWDIINQYGAWAIVEDDIKLYISIQPVPAGIYLYDRNYWEVLIDFTEEIEDIAEIVEALTWKKRYIFIADSYGDAAAAGFDTWIELVPQYMGLDASDFHTVVSNGAAFYTAGVNGTWLQALQAEEDNIDEKEKISNIIVGGWLNDINVSEANVKGAVNMFINYVKTTYPNAKITVMPFDMTLVMNAQHIMTETVKILDVCRYYREALTDAGIGTVNDAAMTFLRNTKFMLPDNRHPNALGEKFLSRCIAGTLLGINVEIPENYATTISGLPNGLSVYGGQSGNWQTWHKGSNAGVIAPSGMELVFDTPQNLSNYSFTFEFDNTCFLPLSGYRQTAYCILIDSSNQRIYPNAILTYMGNSVKVDIFGIHANISHIYLDGMTCSANALY